MDDQRAPSLEKLEALSTASDEMMQSIFWRDRSGTLRTVVRSVHKLLEAESCGIFLVSPDDQKMLVLETAYTDKAADEFRSTSLKIQSIPKEGLTGHIACVGEIVELHGKELTDNRYVAGKKPEHLKSGRCFSLLAVPLKDRKDRLLGLIKVENKKSGDGTISDEVFFTEEDKSIAKILANKIVIVLETLHTSEILRGLTSKMHSAKSVSEILETSLKEGVRLLRGDRGDLATWDDVQRDLVIKYRHGEGGLPKGELLPERSIIRQVWNTGRPRLISKVSEEPDYYCGHEHTESEIVVRLEWEDQHIGVLNIESFQGNGLDAQDIELLQLLGQYAVIAYRAIDKEAHFRGIIQGLGETSPPHKFLSSILESVRDLYRFDGGIIYIADYTNQKLWCDAFISGKALDIKNPRDFSYSFNETSLSTEVFRTKTGLFDPDPWRNPIANRKGLEAFHIEGPIVGVPLSFGGKVVGVLVVWSDTAENSPTEEHKSALEPFASLAATAIAISETESERSKALQAIKEILRLMQTTSPKEELVRLILQGLLRVGFERARIFEFRDEPPQFVVIDSLGIELPGQLRDQTFNIDENPYAQRTRKDALVNPAARIYDPTGPDGPDPDAAIVGKPDDLPWAVVPLVVAGKFYGQVVADNAGSRRLITTDMLDYLTLLGALAAHVIESAQTNQVLNALSLPFLFSGPLGSADLKLTIIKRLLVFLTAGETLGFNRALFLEFDEERGELKYAAGLGSITHERFTENARNATKEGLTNIFDRAGELGDPDLDAVMDGFRVDTNNDITARTLLQGMNLGEFTPSDIATWPHWMRNLAERIDANHVLVAPVRTERTVFGLLCVDRRWQQPLAESDKAALATSAHMAALILRQHLTQRFSNPYVSEAAPSFLSLKSRTVTICFWDIRGFSDLCVKLERYPNLIADFLKDYYNVATEVIEIGHNGIVDKFIGDGVMALFGLLNSEAGDDSEDPGAIDAVYAAIALRTKFDAIAKKWISKWKKHARGEVTEISLGCGINTGKVLVGTLGTGFRDQFTALGTDVNFTARIEARATAGQILVSQTTKEWVKSIATFTKGGMFEDIKGMPGRHPVFAVKSVKARRPKPAGKEL